jgi:hypothetical protein
MTSPTAAPKLLDHLERFLGRICDIESGETSEGHRGYDLVEYHLEDRGVASVITNGLRFQDITTLQPQELVCTLYEDQRHIARYFTDAMARLTLKHQRGLEYGFHFDNRRPLVEGTEICGLLAHPSPLFGEEFDLVWNEAGAIAMQIITLIPLTDPEIEFVEAEGPERMWEVFQLHRVDVLDVKRESAV